MVCFQANLDQYYCLNCPNKQLHKSEECDSDRFSLFVVLLQSFSDEASKIDLCFPL